MKKLIIILITFQCTFSFAQIVSLSPCQEAQLNATGLIGEFVPQCEEDGSFASTQCWGSTGECWCVDENGNEIPGTISSPGQGMPDCTSAIDACTLSPDPGMCFAAIQMYYFNQETQQCEDFTWGGCGGVVPFESLAECEAAACSQSTNDCCINPTWINPNAMCVMIWDPVTGCDGTEYSNSCFAQASGVTSWIDQSGISTALDWECEPNEVICTSLTGVNIFEVGEWVNPNNPCDMGSCLSNGQFIGLAIDCVPLGCNDPWCLPCDGEVAYLDDQCCPVCVELEPLCTSYSGIEIYESGDWTNPNNPCDFGFCGEDGFFSGVIIDCPEQMGMPCNGEWVLEDGACCSICLENTNSDCGSISITLNNGWNMIGFACSENTNALNAFAAIQDKIIIAKDGVGNAYLPDWDFNGIGDLERGYGYLIKVSEEISNYNICE